MRVSFLGMAVPIVVCLSLGAAVPAQKPKPKESPQAYKARMAKWRKDQETDLKAPGSWLSVAGLSWLNEGDNTIGSDPSCRVLLPEGKAPAKVGVLNFHDGKVNLHVEDGVTVTIGGKPVTTAELKSDAEGKPDKVAVGGVTFTVIQRIKRTGIRTYDPTSKARVGFTGEKWFPVDPAMRIKAKFMTYAKPKMMPITNVIGDVRMAPSPGYVVFTVNGKKCRLEAEATDTGLFFNFVDKTSGESTYPAGRFLDADKPVNGWVIVDFNQATNPPCAFTAFATCPLAPRANHLAVAIKAGEKSYHPSAE